MPPKKKTTAKKGTEKTEPEAAAPETVTAPAPTPVVAEPPKPVEAPKPVEIKVVKEDLHLKPFASLTDAEK